MHPVHDDVLAFIDAPERNCFDSLAFSVFTHLFETVRPYRNYCQARGVTPWTVTDWRHIPPVPIRAFKTVDLCCETPERTFLSTGTTAGLAHRSRHCMSDVRLYRRAALAGLRMFLFPDMTDIRILALVPPAASATDSSLAQMVGWAVEAFGSPNSAYVADTDRIDFDQLTAALRESERSGQPCGLMATTAALMRVLDLAHVRGLGFRLPHGSRVMDTGGSKGVARPLSRRGLMHACWNTLGIPGYFCVNEYGMCELSSQFYDNVVAERRRGRIRPRYLVGPHWVRTLVLDPVSLAPAPPGTPGVLCHYDLANAGSAMAVLTEDIGRTVDEGFELLGRARDAEVRGCSLSLAEWEGAATGPRAV